MHCGKIFGARTSCACYSPPLFIITQYTAVANIFSARDLWSRARPCRRHKIREYARTICEYCTAQDSHKTKAANQGLVKYKTKNKFAKPTGMFTREEPIEWEQCSKNKSTIAYTLPGALITCCCCYILSDSIHRPFKRTREARVRIALFGRIKIQCRPE